MTARLGDRSLFPDLAAQAYLNHAGVSPPSLPVRRAVDEFLAEVARSGVLADGRAEALRARLRQALASLVGGSSGDVALTAGLTSAVQAVALCVPWKEGDRVILFEGEFPANVTPWQRAAALHRLAPVMLPVSDLEGGGRGLSRLEEELRRGARMVAVSAVQFRTGWAMPLAEMAALCARHGAEICVDAIQAVGAMPLDAPALGIDYLACGAHKWLMGIHGAGFLWVRPGRAPALRPVLAGWLSHEDPIAFLTRGAGHLRSDRPLRRDARVLEGGSSAVACQAALLTAAEILLRLGVGAIHAHANAWLDRLEPGLRRRGLEPLRSADPGGRSAFFSARPPPGVDGPRLRAALQARGVQVACPDGLLRFAPHWPNGLGEVEGVLAALDGALAAP